MALAESLKTNSTLEELELVNCDIGPAGGKAIGEALQLGMAVLTDLNLRANNLGPQGAAGLGESGTQGRRVVEPKPCTVRHRGRRAAAREPQPFFLGRSEASLAFICRTEAVPRPNRSPLGPLPNPYVRGPFITHNQRATTHNELPQVGHGRFQRSRLVALQPTVRCVATGPLRPVASGPGISHK